MIMMMVDGGWWMVMDGGWWMMMDDDDGDGWWMVDDGGWPPHSNTLHIASLFHNLFILRVFLLYYFGHLNLDSIAVSVFVFYLHLLELDNQKQEPKKY